MKIYKNKKTGFAILLVIAMMFSSVALSAQGKPGKTRPAVKAGQSYGMMNRIPDLTDAQREQIKKLRTAMLKEIMPLQNKLGEKRARLRTLSTADKPDMTAINKLIDEMAGLRAEILKKRMKFVQDVRALLTDEQRVFFDQHAGKGKGRMHGKPHPGYGKCKR